MTTTSRDLVVGAAAWFPHWLDRDLMILAMRSVKYPRDRVELDTHRFHGYPPAVVKQHLDRCVEIGLAHKVRHASKHIYQSKQREDSEFIPLPGEFWIGEMVVAGTGLGPFGILGRVCDVRFQDNGVSVQFSPFASASPASFENPFSYAQGLTSPWDFAPRELYPVTSEEASDHLRIRANQMLLEYDRLAGRQLDDLLIALVNERAAREYRGGNSAAFNAAVNLLHANGNGLSKSRLASLCDVSVGVMSDILESKDQMTPPRTDPEMLRKAAIYDDLKALGLLEQMGIEE